MKKAMQKQKASAKKLKQVNKPKNWRKKVDWSAAGRKAYETRMKNQKHGKVDKKGVKQAVKKVIKIVKQSKQVKQHGKKKSEKTIGFGNYRVNRDELVKALQASKKTEFAPTEVVSMTWAVIHAAAKPSTTKKLK